MFIVLFSPHKLHGSEHEWKNKCNKWREKKTVICIACPVSEMNGTFTIIRVHYLTHSYCELQFKFTNEFIY